MARSTTSRGLRCPDGCLRAWAGPLVERSLIADTVIRWVRGQLKGRLPDLAESVARFALQAVAADPGQAARALEAASGAPAAERDAAAT